MFTAGKNNYYCHRIVYEAFNGLIKSGLVIDHKNGIKTDNCLENLQAISQSENTKKKLLLVRQLKKGQSNQLI